MSVQGFVGLDLETTGLDERDGEILEIGIALYDLEFTPVSRSCFLVFDNQTFFKIENGLYSEFIQRMHTKSGLFDDIMVYQKQQGARADAVTVASHVCSVLDGWGVDKKTPMFGSSIGFDRRWLAHHMPTVNDKFGYRNIDVSSDMEYLKAKYPSAWNAIEAEGCSGKTTNAGASHRVLDDIADSFDLMRRIDKHIYSKALG